MSFVSSLIVLFAVVLVAVILCVCPKRDPDCPICSSKNIDHRQDGLALCLNCGAEFLGGKK